MEKFKSLKEQGFNIISVLGVVLIVIFVFEAIFKLLIPVPILPGFSQDVFVFNVFIMSCIMAPIFEELVFRKLFMDIFKDIKGFETNQWALIFLSGIIFGWLHGNYYNLFVQGVAGIGFAYIYVKNEYSYTSAVIAHSLYNLIVGVIIPFIV